jgi:hypothetical protein
MEIVACPVCGAPAEVEPWGDLGSTSGRVEHVRTMCVRRHWLLAPRESVMSAEPESQPEPQREPVRDPDELRG